MSTLGAALAALAVSGLCLALRTSSPVGRHLDLIAPPSMRRPGPWRLVSERELRQAGLRATPDQFVLVKIAACLAALLAATVVALFVPVGVAVVGIAAYAGWAAPSLLVATRASRGRREGERAAIVLVERVDALVAAGRPPETALARILTRPTGARVFDSMLVRVHEAYLLGAPLFRTLAHHAREDGLDVCGQLADDLERARDMGAASAAILRERRSALRAAERARSLDAAARVEGKLMLVLALCYLPALMLLVVIPLFISLLDGLGT